MTETDIEKIINSFKDANQSLRKRAITIGILMILTIGLTYNENVRYETVWNLISYQYQLGEITRLQDTTFQKVVDGDDRKYFPFDHSSDGGMEHLRLFEKVKLDSYNKRLIEEAIDNVDARIDELNKEKNITILGLNIPVVPVTYVSLLIILILFHDFTQITIYRNQIYRKIKMQKIPSWKLGFELFGFYNTTNKPSLKFLSFGSSVIAGSLMLMPLITSFLMLGLDNYSNSELLFLMNIFCVSLIIIDTMIILYSENVWNFRYYSNLFLGKYPLSIFKMRFVWICPLFLIAMVEFEISLALDTVSTSINIIYLMINLMPLILLYISLEKAYKSPTRFWRNARGTLLIANALWSLNAIHHFFSEYIRWEFYKLQDYAFALLIDILISACVVFIYRRYFVRTNNNTLR